MADSLPLPGVWLCAGCALANRVCVRYPMDGERVCVGFEPRDADAREGAALALAWRVLAEGGTSRGAAYFERLAALVGPG